MRKICGGVEVNDGGFGYIQLGWSYDMEHAVDEATLQQRERSLGTLCHHLLPLFHNSYLLLPLTCLCPIMWTPHQTFLHNSLCMKNATTTWVSILFSILNFLIYASLNLIDEKKHRTTKNIKQKIYCIVKNATKLNYFQI